MSVFLICALVWLGCAVAFLVLFVHAARRDDLAVMDVSREEWQAHCDEALAVGNGSATLFLRTGDLVWSATDEAAYRFTVERAT